MTLDFTTILIIAGAAVAAILLLWLILRPRQRPIEQKPRPEGESPYVASTDRPYVKPPAASPPPPAVAPPGAEEALPDVTPIAPSAALDEDADVGHPAPPLAAEFVGIAMPPGATDHADDLTRLKGVGPKLAAMLNEQGIFRYEQIASFDEGDVAALDARLGTFRGRLARDRVVEQARFLASGDTTGFEERFGKLGG